MKISRNQLCPCGSGLKYKRCCLNKPKTDNTFINPFMYHYNYLHTKKVKATEINQKLLNIYDNRENMSTKGVIDNYLEIMNYVLDYADKNGIHTVEELDSENIVSDFISNIINDFEDEILNANAGEYDLKVTNEYLDKLLRVLNFDDNTYENNLRDVKLAVYLS